MSCLVCDTGSYKTDDYTCKSCGDKCDTCTKASAECPGPDHTWKFGNCEIYAPVIEEICFKKMNV